MADQKISQLPSGAPAQAGDEYVVARSGANYKLTLTNIAANMPATTVASGNLIVSSGNVGIGTASPGTKLTVLSATNAGISVTDGTVTTIMYNSTGGVASIGTTSNHGVNLLTNNATRVTFDSSGNVGIGGTAGGTERLALTGTLPSSGATSRTAWATATIPSTSTTDGIGFQSSVNTQAASFTLGNLFHFVASAGTIGAGSTVTNQYGFHALSNLTGATNNYGFYSNIASGSNRWNFYAAGTARNYFAGRTDVGNTQINATNSWNGAHINAAAAINLASGASIDITSSLAGSVLICVYVEGSGNGGLFWGNYSTLMTKIAGNGEPTDTGSDFAVYKGVSAHVITLKNKAGSNQIFRVSVLAGLTG